MENLHTHHIQGQHPRLVPKLKKIHNYITLRFKYTFLRHRYVFPGIKLPFFYLIKSPHLPNGTTVASLSHWIYLPDAQNGPTWSTKSLGLRHKNFPEQKTNAPSRATVYSPRTGNFFLFPYIYLTSKFRVVFCKIYYSVSLSKARVVTSAALMTNEEVF